MDGSEARDTFFISVRLMCRKGDILLAGKARTNASSRVFEFMSSAICVVCYLSHEITIYQFKKVVCDLCRVRFILRDSLNLGYLTSD
jgi:hypothetical protein